MKFKDNKHRNYVFVLLFILSISAGVNGRARLVEPPMRSSIWRQNIYHVPVNTQDEYLNCGGFEYQWVVANGNCGSCGDPFYGPIENVYPGLHANNVKMRKVKQGKLLNITVFADSNLLGYIRFSLCPEMNGSEFVDIDKCFGKYPLKIWETSSTTYYVGSGGGNLDLRLVLPPDVHCEHCVLQWVYVTGYRTGRDLHSCRDCLGCGPQETYINCADFTIIKTQVTTTGIHAATRNGTEDVESTVVTGSKIKNSGNIENVAMVITANKSSANETLILPGTQSQNVSKWTTETTNSPSTNIEHLATVSTDFVKDPYMINKPLGVDLHLVIDTLSNLFRSRQQSPGQTGSDAHHRNSTKGGTSVPYTVSELQHQVSQKSGSSVPYTASELQHQVSPEGGSAVPHASSELQHHVSPEGGSAVPHTSSELQDSQVDGSTMLQTEYGLQHPVEILPLVTRAAPERTPSLGHSDIVPGINLTKSNINSTLSDDNNNLTSTVKGMPTMTDNSSDVQIVQEKSTAVPVSLSDVFSEHASVQGFSSIKMFVKGEYCFPNSTYLKCESHNVTESWCLERCHAGTCPKYNCSCYCLMMDGNMYQIGPELITVVHRLTVLKHKDSPQRLCYKPRPRWRLTTAMAVWCRTHCPGKRCLHLCSPQSC